METIENSVKTTQINLGIDNSLEWFINHSRVSDNGNSVVLTDSGGKMVAFFDRATSLIEQVQGNFIWEGHYAVELVGEYGEPVEVKRKTVTGKWNARSVGSEMNENLLTNCRTYEK